MGCFIIACFRGSKRRRPAAAGRAPPPKVPISIPTPLLIPQTGETYKLSRQSIPQKPPVAASIPRKEAESESFESCRKRVTFDLDNIKAYENVPSHEDLKLSSVDGDAEMAEKKGEHCSGGEWKSGHKVGEDDNTDIGDEDGFFDGGNEESYDSYFSLPLSKEYIGSEELSSAEKRLPGLEEVDSPSPFNRLGARERIDKFTHSVLNPVENLVQWKEVKVRREPAEQPEKENIDRGAEIRSVGRVEPEAKGVRKKHRTPDTIGEEVSVDASLSSWMFATPAKMGWLAEDSPCIASSPSPSTSREEQPILGALTIEDVRLLSVSSSSSRRSPSRSPDEIPILGASARQWSSTKRGANGIPNTNSKYKEDKRVSWHSTPFQARLERALEISKIEARSIRPGV